MKITATPNKAHRHRAWPAFGMGLVMALAVISTHAETASSSKKAKKNLPSQQTTQAVPTTAPPPQSTLAPVLEIQTAPPVMPVVRNYSFGEVVTQSVSGDVYSDPSRWQELGFRNLFTTGWNQPWESPPTGGGGARRQGWINAYDGVFFRLSIASFAWQHGLANNSDGYTGTLTSYTPLNQRMEIRTDIGLASDRGPTGLANAQTNFSDFIVTPRILLSESKEQSQVFEIYLRTPTGNSFNGNGIASISPTYEFWTNYWKGLVVRGGLGFNIPYSGDITKAGARSTFNGNLAIGYYLTPHDAVPFGDFVVYVTNNFNQAIDTRGPNSTMTFTMGPGFRTHLGDNWYLLGQADFGVTNPQPYDYQISSGIMKVY